MAGNAKMTRIDTLLADLFRKKQWEKRLGLHAIFQSWPKVVGGEIAGRAVPQVIRGTVLWVAVSDSVWMQQLHLQKPLLLARINDSLPGPERISDIRFQLEASLEERKAEAEPAPEPSATRAIDPEEKKRFESLLASIPDPENRQRLLSLWVKTHRRLLPEKE